MKTISSNKWTISIVYRSLHSSTKTERCELLTRSSLTCEVQYSQSKLQKLLRCSITIGRRAARTASSKTAFTLIWVNELHSMYLIAPISFCNAVPIWVVIVVVILSPFAKVRWARRSAFVPTSVQCKSTGLQSPLHISISVKSVLKWSDLKNLITQ